MWTLWSGRKSLLWSRTRTELGDLNYGFSDEKRNPYNIEEHTNIVKVIKLLDSNNLTQHSDPF